MVSTGNAEVLIEIKEQLPSTATPNGSYEASGEKALNISASRRGLLSDGSGSLSIPSRMRNMKFGSPGRSASPSARFRQIAEERDEISRSVPSSAGHGFQERFNGVLAGKIDWASLRKLCKEWIKNPFNMALLFWISCVAVSGAILFLVMTGMLNAAIPKKSQRNAWFEVNNQILNALFTLMCLYQHPKRFYHLVLLCRWKPKDISTLRQIYCKNGTYKPHEWAHMMVVVVLLHLNCFAQYALCGLNLGFKRSERPAIGVGICISVAIGAPAIAGVYSIVSPLGKDYASEADEEAQDQILNAESRPSHPRLASLEKRFSFASRDEQLIVENRPEWRGGLFDIWDDITLAYLSLFCSFCVFGWNMERLGFGNMYVHIATFLLFCMAPFWIFNLAANTLDNDTVREALGISGIILCVFGLLYGGFWRIQMRKRFNLPANNACCGKPEVADCAQWLCCCWCSLAQEVRTADFYGIVEDKFYRKETGENDLPALSPLPREDGGSPLWNSPRLSKLRTENSPSPTRLSKDYYSPDRQLPKVEEEVSTVGVDNTMKPPVPSLIQREDNTTQKL